MPKRPDVIVNARADVATIRVAVEQAHTPRAEVSLDPSAARELIRQLEDAVEVAVGNAVERRNGDGDPVQWSDAVGFRLSAFAPRGTIR